MEDASYSKENAVARLYEISTSSNLSDQATLFIKNQQIAYDTWIASGGRPDILGQPLHTRGAFEIYVHRIESADFVETGLFQRNVIRAWQGMPLFAGDILETSQNSIAAIELLIGGRVGIKSADSILCT